MSSDVITALVLRRNRLEWTTLQQKKDGWEVAEQKAQSFELPAGIQDLNAPESVAVIKPLVAGLRGRLVIAVPTEQALLRVARFPTSDLAEIRSMAELQVDKFCPFPLEHIRLGLEVLDLQDGGTRTLIAAVQRDHVEKLGAFARLVDLGPRTVDIEILGWWYLLNASSEIKKEGREVLLLVDERSSELIIVQHGVPVLFRALDAYRPENPLESATEVADEINFTLTTMETEWGIMDAVSLQVWHREAIAPEFLDGLRQGCACEVATRPLDRLPPLSEGLARRAMVRDELVMDLAPPEWGHEFQDRKTRKAALVAAAVLLGLWLFVFLIGFAALQVQKSRTGRIKSAYNAVSGAADQVRQVRDQVESLSQYSDRSRSGLECLREVTELLPPGVELSSFEYQKYEKVFLRGSGEASDPVYEFFKRLEESEVFLEIKPEGITDEVRNGQRRAMFKVSCALKANEAAAEEAL
jgi:hypothetical protein